MGKDDKDHLELAKNRHGETISRINVIYDRIRNTIEIRAIKDQVEEFIQAI
jgi:hypothetical protein